VVYLHGVPSSRLEVALFGLADAARRAGVRLVAVDRAGIGGSAPKPGRTLRDTAHDVAAVADALGLDRFALVGYSAGAPSALATAAALATRVSGLAIVSGVPPGDRADLAHGQSPEVARMFRWARNRGRMLPVMLRIMRVGTRRPAALVKAAGKGAPASDLEVLDRPGAAEDFAAFLAAAFQQGTAGVRADFELAAGPWDFPLSQIRMPVRIWHGELDRNAPVAAARWLHEQLPHSRLHIMPSDGHASLIAAHGADILAALTASR
jgi:pimeloyl-ACP methyl ester carboxylesterase